MSKEEEKFEGYRSLIDASRISTESIIRFSEKDGKYRAILNAMNHVATDLFAAYDQHIISSAHLRNGITETVRAFARTAYSKSGSATIEVVTQLIVLRIFTLYKQQKNEDREMKEELANAI